MEDDDARDQARWEMKKMKMEPEDQNTCPGKILEDFLQPGTRAEHEKSSRSPGEKLSGLEEIVAMSTRSGVCSGGQMLNCPAQAAIKWTSQASFEPGEGGKLDLQ